MAISAAEIPGRLLLRCATTRAYSPTIGRKRHIEQEIANMGNRRDAFDAATVSKIPRKWRGS